MYSKTSPLMEIYNKIDLTDSRYLFRYGIYITENEVKGMGSIK